MKFLFFFAFLCVVIAVGIWGFDAYTQYTFRQKIEPIWAEAPVTSTPTPIEDKNTIVIYFDEETLSLDPTSTADLQKCDTGGDDRYDLGCSFGKFRIFYYGDLYTELTSAISAHERPFDVIRKSLMLDNESRASTAPLWVVRTQIMPIGYNTRLQHFETPHKMGIISGTISNRPYTMLSVFDASGEYSIGILPLEPGDTKMGRACCTACAKEKASGNEWATGKNGAQLKAMRPRLARPELICPYFAN